jgi:hypothetical protein
LNKKKTHQATHRIGYALTANGHLLHCKRLTSINAAQKTAQKKHIKVIQGNAMDIDPNKAINYITQNAGVFAKAKADRTFVENNLRVVKSELMNEEEGTLGNKEAYAYAHPNYKAQLVALREATEIEESLLWMMKAAVARIEVYKVQEYSKRAEMRNLG